MKPRPLVAVALLLVLAPLLGALLAPLVYDHVVPLLHRQWPHYRPFDAPDLPRVLNRCVLVATLAFLVPALRLSGLWPTLRAALRLDGARLRVLAVAVALGLGSMGLAYVVGWLLGGYRISDEFTSWTLLANRMGVFLVGAVFIGLFEECFFRGFLFGALRQRLGFLPAALLASAVFASVHFLQPPEEAVAEGTRWNAGLALLPSLFGGFDPSRDAAFAATLFLMGLAFCWHYEDDRHLWRIAGLHAGWVWSMQLGAFALDHNWAIMRGVLGPSDYIAQGSVAIPIVLAFLAAAILRSPRRRFG